MFKQTNKQTNKQASKQLGKRRNAPLASELTLFLHKYCQGFSAGICCADSPGTEKSGRKAEEKAG